MLLPALMLASVQSSFSQSSDDENIDDYATVSYFDSLRQVMLSLPMDTSRLRLLNKISYEHYNSDSTLFYAQQEVSLARKLNNPFYEIHGLQYLSWAYYTNGDFKQSVEVAFQGLNVASQYPDVDTLSLIMLNNYVANGFSMMMDSEKCIDYYKKSLSLATASGDKDRMAAILLNLGQENADNMLFDDACQCVDSSLSLYAQIGDLAGVANSRYTKGIVYYSQLEFINEEQQPYFYEKAKAEYLQAYKLYDSSIGDYRSNSYADQLRIVKMMCTLMLDFGLPLEKSSARRNEILDSCRCFIGEAFRLLSKCDSESSSLAICRADYFINKGEYTKAEAILDSLSAQIDMDDFSNYNVASILCSYVDLYTHIKNYEKALKYSKMRIDYMKYNQNKTYAATMTRSIAEIEYEHRIRQNEIEASLRESVLQDESRLRLVVILLLVVVVTITVIGLVHYKRNLKILDDKNDILEEQHEEICSQNENLEKQKSVIEAQNIHLEAKNQIIQKTNDELISSLNYAKMIQAAAMPTSGQMEGVWGNCMSFFRPLSIVSGDFYWTYQTEKYQMLAVADSTGHGVPGAFLSMLGISILNELAANIERCYLDGSVSASRMLDLLNRHFKVALRQSGSSDSNKDGMDVAIVIVDYAMHMVHYAGAFRPLIYLHDGVASKIDPDRMSIGQASVRHGNFSEKVFHYEISDRLYLFSDGITDQFGYNDKNELRKLTLTRLVNMLTDMWNVPMNQQYQAFSDKLYNWRMGNYDKPYEQIDDMLLVGVELIM